MIRQKILVTIFLLVTSAQVYSQSISPAKQEALRQILYQYTDDESPGLAVGIVQDGKVVYENYVGYANLSHQVKIDQKSRFNIASTAKQFTALMILQLSEEGKLSLEDDIRKYIPALYPKVKEEIKIRHLINHSSGIRDYVFLLEIQDKPFWRQVGMDNGDVIELLEKQEELVFKPGSHYLYSNSNYTILTKIIEKISGEKFNDYSDAFFRELGMNETSFVKRYMGVIPHRVDPYSDWGSGEWFQDITVTKFNGDGFLYTTLPDQLKYEQAVQQAPQNNNTLLIKSQGPIPNSEITTYGFGLELDGRLGRDAPYHSGSTFGAHSHVSRFPEEKLSVFVMSNNGKIWSGDIADDIASVFLPKMEKKVVYDPRFSKSSSKTESTQILGQYHASNGTLIRIVEEEGKTYWRKENASRLELIRETNNTYAAAYDSKVKMVFSEKEMLVFYPDGKVNTYERSAELPASLADLEGLEGEYYSQELGIGFELKLSKEKELKLLFSDWKEKKVQVINRNEFLTSNFILKAQRDPFDRATDILVTLNYRAKNNRFRKKSNLKFQPQIATDFGSIQVTTIGSSHGKNSDILLTANHPNGNEIWAKRLGGSSYDKASSILATEDGYLIIGSTSSYGNGNYDMYVIKTD
ncbi:MAG: serine hydrolase domain-containing protein, partial [Bacteroidota bacterium]